MIVISDTKIPDELFKSVIQMAISGQIVPLAHNLFSDAWKQSLENNRSSLVIAIAAAETAIKQCVGELLPQEEHPAWYVKSKQSPPIKTLLLELLPTFQARGKIKGRGYCLHLNQVASLG